MSEIFFSLDPGSIRTGWALMRPGERLIKAGLLLPDKQAVSSEFRIEAICRSLWTLLNYWLPGVIIVEWNSGKISKRHGSGGGAGLAVLGCATGALWREVVAWTRYLPAERQLVTNVILIRENDWTRQVPKSDRIVAIGATYPEYNPVDDPHGDIADAIGLNIFYQREREVRLVECLR